MKKIFTTTILLLLIFSISAVVGCTNSNKEDGTTTTTTEKEKATTVEITTEEITTKEPTTNPLGEFVMTFYVWEEELDYFEGLVVEPGHKFILNDIVPNSEENVKRGMYASDITYLGKNSVGTVFDLQDMYLEEGQSNMLIPYEENLCIEYQDEKKLIFYNVGLATVQYEFKVYAID